MNQHKQDRIKSIHYLRIFIFIFVLISMGCKKMLNVDTPPDKISTESAFKDDATATAVLTGIIGRLSDQYLVNLNLPATSVLEELSADNLLMYDVNVNDGFRTFYQNSLEPQYLSSGTPYWSTCYSMMYNINASIEGLKNNKYLTPSVNKRLLGEAYFLRSFVYFYLTNIFGDVPLILTTKYDDNAGYSRIQSMDVYNQIISDLSEAEQLLDYNYAESVDITKNTFERTRPNLATVNALQSRVFLYLKNYALAEANATKIIDRLDQFSLSSLKTAFLKNSSETIWSLQPVNNNFNTKEGGLFILNDNGPDGDHPLLVSPSLMKSFEFGDGRKEDWIGKVVLGTDTFFYPAKYKTSFSDVPEDSKFENLKEYTIVFRLAEQYLIRAESRNELGNTKGAIEDLNAVRTRSRIPATATLPNPLPNLSFLLNQTEIRSIVLNERRVELFTEWGHRWFDLKRTGNIDAAMIAAEAYKGSTWSSYRALYPIPSNEIALNPALSQNPEYTK